VNTSNRDRIPLSDIVSAGNKFSGLEKIQTVKYATLKNFPGGLGFIPT
jgi:hypothetical protein